jgi:hypothetical protein
LPPARMTAATASLSHGVVAVFDGGVISQHHQAGALLPSFIARTEA